ncbi:MAG TPA: transglycosylase SLT domain-containing protein, partial [Pyrinomonadaceae bacterium]|nr:transglycosylase SLT domain-containing protein [Pyrinomonadaceae bacterium]
MKKLAAIAFAALLSAAAVSAQPSDAALRRVTSADVSSRDANGKLQTLPAAEHLSRAEVYSSNRLFPQAREHWQMFLDNYPSDPGVAKALFGTARSYMWERQYEKAVEWFNRLTKDYLNTKDGREGLAFKGASLVRLGRNLEAAKTYEQYVVMFPDGERVESAYLNIIDAYREAGKYDEANRWVDRTTAQFTGKPTEVNALHARMRMDIFRENWGEAQQTADRLLDRGRFAGSMTSSDEVKYLKALSMERSGHKVEAGAVYASIPKNLNSYFSGLASDKAGGQVKLIASVTPSFYSDYPVMFRSELLQHARLRKIDPRFVLAIMKQESSFRPSAKSPAAARGLLQLVYDTALKYNKKAGYPNLQPDDLYSPSVNIAVGSTYIADL